MDNLQIAIGETGYSVCHEDHPEVGDCLFDGIQEFGIALEVAEMLAGEMDGEQDPCWLNAARQDEEKTAETPLLQ